MGCACLMWAWERGKRGKRAAEQTQAASGPCRDNTALWEVSAEREKGLTDSSF